MGRGIINDTLSAETGFKPLDEELVRRRVQFTFNIELEIEKKSLVASQSDIVTARCFLSTRTELHLECLRLS